MGGLFLSGGGFSSTCGGGCCFGVGGSGSEGGSIDGSRDSPNRPNAPGPVMPLRERGGRLDASSLLAARDVATESWLLLFCAMRLSGSLSRDVVESMLPAGEARADEAVVSVGRRPWVGLNVRGASIMPVAEPADAAEVELW
jgi:hypothetical protein